jgi:2-oxo-3-hexenedioate decarboxylase
MSEAAVEAIAEEAFALLGTGRQTTPFSYRGDGLSLDDAYRVLRRVRRLREGRGERPIGRKIGFTNRTIWEEYQVFAPIWGPMYDGTLFELSDLADGFSVAHLAEPRIEPELAFHFMAAPKPGMTERELLDCIDWVAHGFELVQSIFPKWKFAASDTVAAYALHGAYLIGPRHEVLEQRDAWFRAIGDFEVELYRNGELASRGHSSDVLDGPLSALKHLNNLLKVDTDGPPIAASEIITTGTLTAAMPIGAGDTWSTIVKGIDLNGISVTMK